MSLFVIESGRIVDVLVGCDIGHKQCSILLSILIMISLANKTVTQHHQGLQSQAEEEEYSN